MPANPYYQGPASDHFDGTRFFNPGTRPIDRGPRDLMRWRLNGERAPWPRRRDWGPPARPAPRVEGLSVTQIGHASVLIQAAGSNILVDPVWSRRMSPFRFAGPARAAAPGIDFADLPAIDAVLVTHNHYDHLDIDTLGRLWTGHRAPVIAPLGNDTIIRRRLPGIAITAGDWHDAVTIGAVTVRLVPANHWSARGLGDRRMALWCGFLLDTGAGSVYVAGDTGYDGGAIFRVLRERYGAPRLAILPIGAYEPRWFMEPVHMNPDDAVRAMRDCGAAQALGYHWGTIQLTDEAIDAPARALDAALASAQVPAERFLAMRPGQVWVDRIL